MKAIKNYILESFDLRELKDIKSKARNIALKMSYRIYGGDFNELYNACETGDKKLVYSMCNDINSNYRDNNIFSQTDKKEMIENWEEIKNALEIISNNAAYYNRYYKEKFEK